jgi:hypothetical protein
MALMLAAGSVDRRRAIPRRAPRGCREPTDVADVAEDAGGSGGPDAVQVSQAGAGLVEQFGELLVRGLDLLVDRGEIIDRLRGELAAGLADQVCGRTVASTARAWVTDRNVLPPPGTSSSNSLCSRLTTAVRVTPSSSRRSASIRTTTT